MAETSKKSPDSHRRHRSSSSKKVVSTHLGGGRISSKEHRPAKPSRSHSRRADKKKSHRSSGEKTPAPAVVLKKEHTQSHRPGSKSSRQKDEKNSRPEAEKSWFLRILSFSGFAHTRLTKKNPWIIFRWFCVGAVPLVALCFAAHAVSLTTGRLWLDETLLGPDSFINSIDGILYTWSQVVDGDYTPLPWLTMWIEHFLWGSNGVGYHFFNLVLHSLNAIFVWRLCRHLNLRHSGAWLAGAVFAVHPICFPAVSWIYARPVILGTTFSLASLLAFSNYDKPNSDELDSKWMLMSIIAAVLASFCHAGLALVTPFLALGMMGFRRGTKVNTGSRHILRCFPLLLAVAPGVVISLILALRASPNPFALSWFDQIKTGGWLAARLPIDAVWPTISFFMPPFEPDRLAMGLLPLSGLVISLLGLFLFRRRPIVRPVFFLIWSLALVLFGMTMFLPRTGAFSYGLTGTYLVYPAATVFAVALVSLIAWLFSFTGDIKGAVGTNLAGLALVAILLVGSWSHMAMSGDSEAFWRQAAKNYPDLPVVNEFLARELVRQDRDEEALPLLRRTIKQTPENIAVNEMLGQILLKLGDMEAATFHLRKGFRGDPNLADEDIEKKLQAKLETVTKNPASLGEFLNISALPNQGKSDILDYDKIAFTLNETSFGQKISQAYILAKNKQLDEAASVVKELMDEDPRGAMGNYLAGYIAFHNETFDQAVRHLGIALETQPDLAGGSCLLGMALREEENYPEAVEMLGKAIKLNPKMIPAYYELGKTFEAMNDWRKALAVYDAAIRLKQDHVPSLRERADILATCPDPVLRNGEEALKLAQQALLYSAAENPELLLTLAAAYAEAGFFPDAVKNAKQAVSLATDPDLKKEAQKRLQLFQSGKRYGHSL